MITMNLWDGVPIPVGERDKWIEEAVAKLKKHAREDFYNIHSGDSMIVAFRYDSGEIEVFDCVVKRKASIFPRRN